ncbi:MAG: methionine synthase [Oscillospiraceae bacterium]
MKTLEIEIDKAEALRYAGHRHGPLTEPLQRLLDDCCEKTHALARPRMVFRVFSIADHSPVRLAGTDLVLEGGDAEVLLKQSKACVLMAVTIGNGVEPAIRSAQVTDMTRALFLDACASAAVESVCEAGERALRKQLGGPPPFFTRRYSPGYGDLPLTLQRPLLQLLDAGRKIGLSVSESGLLTPRKSVTAIIGLNDAGEEAGESGCASCGSRETCLYRKEGTSCEQISDKA